VAVADLKGDGKPDLVTANASGGFGGSSSNVSVLLGNGDGTFQAAQNYQAGPNPAAVAVVDVNSIGIPSLVVANPSANSVSVLFGRGTEAFYLPPRFPSAPSHLPRWRSRT